MKRESMDEKVSIQLLGTALSTTHTIKKRGISFSEMKIYNTVQYNDPICVTLTFRRIQKNIQSSLLFDQDGAMLVTNKNHLSTKILH